MPDNQGTDPALPATTDGLVTICAPSAGDARALIAGRDAEFHRWLGPGTEEPDPVGCVLVGGRLVGWVDYDRGHDWLRPGEVNVGYHLFAPDRGRGYATRAVQLLLHHLAVRTPHTDAALVIDPANERSLALAARIGAARAGVIGASAYFRRPVPPVSYSDGVVTIRQLRATDLEASLEAIDEEQLTWLWLPWQRHAWNAMTPSQRRAHAAASVRQRSESFGPGPRWAFAVDAADARHAAYVECDLASEHAPPGDANISYSSNPAHRGKGYVSRAVRLAMRFLRDQTGARQAFIVVDSGNVASLRVARAVGAAESGRWVNESGRTMVRHVLDVTPGGRAKRLATSGPRDPWFEGPA